MQLAYVSFIVELTNNISQWYISGPYMQDIAHKRFVYERSARDDDIDIVHGQRQPKRQYILNKNVALTGKDSFRGAQCAKKNELKAFTCCENIHRRKCNFLKK